jgi:hypothetical protein
MMPPYEKTGIHAVGLTINTKKVKMSHFLLKIFVKFSQNGTRFRGLGTGINIVPLFHRLTISYH